jgi:hypothetical protein
MYMNRFVKAALALAVAGSAANAGTGDNEWLALDSEITGLASTLKPSQDGMSWAALIRGVYSHSSDDIATNFGGNDPDLSGFGFNDIDLAFWGTQGSYRWRISGDLNPVDIITDDGGTPFDPSDDTAAASQSNFTLEDAYVAWSCGGMFEAMMGNMKPRVSRSNSVDPEGLFFIDRTALGSAFDGWDNGIAVTGMMDMLAWYVFILNGSNGHTRDHLYVLRGEFKLGDGAGMYDGARGAGDVMNGTIGLSYVNDNTIPSGGEGNGDTAMFLVDFSGSISQFGFSAEVAKIDDDFGALTDEDFSNLATRLAFDPDSTPWNAAVTFMVNSEWEIGARLENLDNGEFSGDYSILTLGANWYRGAGNGKWTAQWSDFDADSGFDDGSIIEIGYTIGATR